MIVHRCDTCQKEAVAGSPPWLTLSGTINAQVMRGYNSSGGLHVRLDGEYCSPDCLRKGLFDRLDAQASSLTIMNSHPECSW
jgi:hypothetical protein